MLKITIPELWSESFDEKTNTFVYKMVDKERTLQLEHSLVSISKWEAKWHKAFLKKEEKTDEEYISYIKCMTLTQNVPDSVYERININHIQEIEKYISDPMTAIYEYGDGGGRTSSGDTITSELIYYWMITLNIPVDFQKWHLNRLLSLIRVCNKKNDPNKNSMSASEIRRRNKALNAQRRAKTNSKG